MPLALQSDYLLVAEIEALADIRGIVSPYGRHATDPVRAVVLNAGPGYVLPDGSRAPMLASVGDTVWLQFNAGTEVRIDGETRRFVLDRDLFAVERA